MKQEYKDKLPQWYNDENGKYNLMLSNDIDSLLACKLLQEIKQWNTEYFYDFSHMRHIENKTQGKKIVGVDIAINYKDAKCFDNHITRLSKDDTYNPNTINPNILNNVSRDNYYNKYCGSTALLIWSLYGLPLPKTELGKMILLAIDTTYKGYYGGSLFKRMNEFYIRDMFGYEELVALENKHIEQDFKDIIREYNLYSDITIKEQYLSSNLKLKEISEALDIELELPKEKFILCSNLHNKYQTLTNQKLKSEINDNIFSCALTGKNQINYSLLR